MSRSARNLTVGLLLVWLPQGLIGANWSQWRGAFANGISDEKGVPLEWGPERNILWKSALPGLGTSTPIVWDDSVFVTSQIGNGPYEGRSQDFPDASKARKSDQPGKV